MLGACCDGESPENEVKAMTMMDYDDILDSLLLSDIHPNNVCAHKVHFADLVCEAGLLCEFVL
jgi:hypothetical protein